MNILFPVLLKYVTCIITDNVSNTGINAIISNINGICKYSAIADITPPNNNEPVSPIIIFAGFKLNTKNPKHTPTTILPKTTISLISNIIAITVKHVTIIADILAPNPSIPSVKFTAFVVPNITNIANGINNHIGSGILIFKKGIIVSVPRFSPSIKYSTYSTDTISNPSILYFGLNPFVFLNTTFLKSSIKPIIPNPNVINNNGKILFATAIPSSPSLE